MDHLTQSRVNLNAVFRVLGLLVERDDQARQLIAGIDQTIQFTSPRVTVRLAIRDGRISHHKGPGPHTMNLAFPSAQSVNKMFDGTGLPIPLKGLTKIKILTGPFSELTDRLSYFLRPTDDLLADPSYRYLNTLLTLYLAIYATAEIGNSDQQGRQTAGRIPDCDIQLAIKDGPALFIKVRDHLLRVFEGSTNHANARMIFTDIEVAGAVLRGETPAFEAIGHDQIALSGRIPILDDFNKLLARVPQYLS